MPSTYRTGGRGSWHVIWNISFKLFYLLSSAYLIFLMMKVYPRTRERERAWKLGLWSVAGSVILAPISIWLLESEIYVPWIIEVSWTKHNHPSAASLPTPLVLLGFLHYS
jgi:hypothetical protein